MPPRFLYPFLAYRSFLLPILVLSAIVVPCWLGFRLYRLRARGLPLSFGRELLLLTFVLYLSGLAAVTLEPNRSSRYRADNTVGLELRPSVASLACTSATGPRGSTARSFCARNARGNFLLFVPLGILLPLVGRRLRFWNALRIAIALSVSIEILQYVSRTWGVNRTADVNDVILNVAGACVGLMLVSLARTMRSPVFSRVA